MTDDLEATIFNLDLDAFSREHMDAVARIAGEPLVTDQDEEEVRICLALAWEIIVHYGSSTWTLSSCPRLATSTLVTAAARGWMNQGGYESERADTVTLSRYEDFARGVELTTEEQERIEGAAGRHAQQGVMVSAPLRNSYIPLTRGAQERRRPWGAIPYGYGMSPQANPPLPVNLADFGPNANVMPYRGRRGVW